MAAAGVGWDDLAAVAVHAGPRPHRRAAGRPGGGQGHRLPPRPAAHPRQPPPGPHRRQLRPRRGGALRLPRRQRRPHAARRRRGGRALPRRGAHHGRRRRRGLRQGRPPARASAIRAARSSTSWRRAATRASRASRAPCRAAATSASAASRRRCSTTCASRDAAEVEAHRADIAASYQAAIVGQLVDKTRGLRRRARACAASPIAGGVAANSGLRARARRALRGRGPAAVAAAAQPVHRQRRHDRPGGRLPAGACPGPSTSALDAFASDAEAKAARPAAARGAAPPPRARRSRCRPCAVPRHPVATETERGTVRGACASGTLASRMGRRPQPVFPGRRPEESPRIAAEFFVECLENEGVEYVFGIPGEETLDLNEALDRSDAAHLRPRAPRAGRRLHGRRLRPAHRQARRLPRHARPRRHQPRHGHRRRQPRQRAAGRAHRPGRARRHAQGDAPVHRHRRDAAPHDQVEHAHPRPAHDRRGGAQGVLRGRRGEARARRTSSCPRT